METCNREHQSVKESLSYDVIRAVAGFKDTEPQTLQPPLYDAIDPEALDNLFGNVKESAREKISFTYSGCRITVAEDETVHVQKSGERKERTT